MKIRLFILITLMLMCSGCGNWMCDNIGWFCPDPPSNKPEVNTVEDIQETQKIIKESSETIEKASGEIADEANKIIIEANEAKGKIPKEAKAEIAPHIDSIKESSTAILEDTTTINKASAKLVAAQSLLDSAGKKVVIVEDALDKMAEERDSALEAKRKAEADRDSALHKTLQWLIVGCIVGCGAFIVLFFYTGSKGGLFAAGGCGLVLIIAIFVNMYIVWLAIGGGVLLLLMVGWLLYNIYIKNKAFKEIVDTVEIAKSNLPSDKKAELFGGKGQTGIMDGLQSKSTMNLIQKEKSKMSSLWLYAKSNGDK
jgi:hypothetical protein